MHEIQRTREAAFIADHSRTEYSKKVVLRAKIVWKKMEGIRKEV